MAAYQTCALNQQASVAAWIFRKKLEELDQMVVHPLTVVSLLLPPTANLGVVKNRIKEERSKAGNIKSAANKSSVQESLKGVSDYLQGLAEVPQNGVALYFGSHVVNPGTGEAGRLRHILHPPVPVQNLVYSSDHTCLTAPLWKLVNARQGSIGYVIVDGSQATIAVVSDVETKVVYNESVHLP